MEVMEVRSAILVYVVRDASQLASAGQEGGETGDAIRVWGLWWCGCEGMIECAVQALDKPHKCGPF